MEDPKTGGRSLWEVSVDGTNPHPLLPGVNSPPEEYLGRWTADGKYFLFESKDQIWAPPEKTGFFRRSPATPVKFTDSPLKLSSPLPSKDGKKLFVVGRRLLSEPCATTRSLVTFSLFSREFQAMKSHFLRTASGWRTSAIRAVSSGEAGWMGAIVNG